MKYLQVQTFDHLNPQLHRNEGLHRTHASVGSYSCKKTRKDKRLFKIYCQKTPELLPLAPSSSIRHERNVKTERNKETQAVLSGVFALRKTLFDLLSVLNATYTDYDFMSTASQNFSKVYERGKNTSISDVIDSIDRMLAEAFEGHYANWKESLWRSIDAEISIKDCDVYYYAPDFTNDPFEESAYHFNYFFHNKKMKRIVFFTLRSIHHSRPFEEDEYIDMADEDARYEFAAANSRPTTPMLSDDERDEEYMEE